MAIKPECIAMLLAGGQGSRLGILTKKIAKPAVPYGGKYRIIDFPLSNCVNSGIYTVGVLTQYQPLELNDYIGNGQPNLLRSIARWFPGIRARRTPSIRISTSSRDMTPNMCSCSRAITSTRWITPR